MSGTNYTWTSTGSTGDWSTSGDWNPSGPPGTSGSDSAYLPSDPANPTALDGFTPYTVTVEQAVDLSTLTVGDSNGNVTLDMNVGAGTTVAVGTLILNDYITGTGTLAVTSVLDNPFGFGEIDAGSDSGSGGFLEITNGGSAGATIGSTGQAVLAVNANATLEVAIDFGSVDSANADLLFNNTGGTFSGTIFVANTTVLSSFNSAAGIVNGMDIGGASAAFADRTDVVEIGGISAASITSATIIAGGTIELLSNESTLAAFAATNDSLNPVDGTVDRVDYASDGAGGVDVWLSTLCFAAGARILAATGEHMVENLKVGDAVLTLSGEDLVPRPIKWIGRRKLDLAKHPHPERAAPIRIRRGAIAHGVPHRDLRVSPDHAVMIDDMLICARQLINGTTISQEIDCKSVEYFHIELEAHAILFAEGLTTESYLDTGNRGFFDNATAPLILYPDLASEADRPAREVGSCLPFVSDEVAVRPIWQRLATRAAAEGLAPPRRACTTNPAPYLIAQGRTLQPVGGRRGHYVFSIPAGTTEIRLVSRAAKPTDTRPWLEDRRCLGLHVARLSVRSDTELHDIPMDHPGLSSGWWAPERDGAVLRRWTNGEATIPLPALGHTTMLEIRADSSNMAYLLEAEETRRAA